MATRKLKVALLTMPGSKSARAIVLAVAEELGNTAAVCRKCYIHPRILSALERGDLVLQPSRRGPKGLSGAEQAVLAYLRRKPSKAASDSELGS